MGVESLAVDEVGLPCVYTRSAASASKFTPELTMPIRNARPVWPVLATSKSTEKMAQPVEVTVNELRATSVFPPVV